ncbi:hypothetical protein M513_13614 [Trichuris suis]|uniref:Uncharacterized protein n=1 Tax=Trichuris suis TaxID=68888 RepID=A0A085LKL1_9BILA|nr:hypothetical protein M513_13614 [Trichuris suis]
MQFRARGNRRSGTENRDEQWEHGRSRICTEPEQCTACSATADAANACSMAMRAGAMLVCRGCRRQNKGPDEEKNSSRLCYGLRMFVLLSILEKHCRRQNKGPGEEKNSSRLCYGLRMFCCLYWRNT